MMNPAMLAMRIIQAVAEKSPVPLTPAPLSPVPTPPPMPKGTPAPIPIPSGTEIGHEAIGFVGKIAAFFKYDFFPNLWMYLTLVFMIVLAVLLFAGINFIVRSITDPIFQKIFRFHESSKIPPVIGGILSVIVAVIAFQWVYTTFPALQPPVQFILRKF